MFDLNYYKDLKKIIDYINESKKCKQNTVETKRGYSHHLKEKQLSLRATLHCIENLRDTHIDWFCWYMTTLDHENLYHYNRG